MTEPESHRCGTEADWLRCGNVQPMLWSLKPEPSGRKSRLLGVACCRRIWHLFDDERSLNAVEVAERLADGLATEEERQRAEEAATESLPENYDPFNPRYVALYVNDSDAIVAAGHAAAIAQSMGVFEAVNEVESRWQAAVLRDIVGNPFRPAILDRSRVTATVVRIARAVYDERHLPSGLFDAHRMGVLADALEEAGCVDVAVLDHCRQPTEHIRGCWVVDAILGKE